MVDADGLSVSTSAGQGFPFLESFAVRRKFVQTGVAASRPILTSKR